MAEKRRKLAKIIVLKVLAEMNNNGYTRSCWCKPWLASNAISHEVPIIFNDLMAWDENAFQMSFRL